MRTCSNILVLSDSLSTRRFRPVGKRSGSDDEIIAAGKEMRMDLNTDERNAGERSAGSLALNDVVYVALAIAVILFGNMALVRAMDVALDSLVR